MIANIKTVCSVCRRVINEYQFFDPCSVVPVYFVCRYCETNAETLSKMRKDMKDLTEEMANFLDDKVRTMYDEIYNSLQYSLSRELSNKFNSLKDELKSNNTLSKNESIIHWNKFNYKDKTTYPEKEGPYLVTTQVGNNRFVYYFVYELSKNCITESTFCNTNWGYTYDEKKSVIAWAHLPSVYDSN